MDCEYTPGFLSGLAGYLSGLAGYDTIPGWLAKWNPEGLELLGDEPDWREDIEEMREVSRKMGLRVIDKGPGASRDMPLFHVRALSPYLTGGRCHLAGDSCC